MELTVSLKYGPLDAEFTGESREEVEDNLLSFVEFLAENEEAFDGLGFDLEPGTSEEEEQAGLDQWSTGNKGGIENSAKPAESGSADSPLSSIAKRIGASIGELEELIYISVEDEELPMILIDDLDRLGGSVVEQQRNAALLLLLIWNKCYEKEKMKTSDIKNIFSMMDVSTSNTYRAWEKSYFKQKGQGSSATIQLRGPGEREAYSLLNDLLEEDQS